MRHIKIGRYDCFSLTDSFFRLDGGAMFGIVPKTIWNGFYDCDEKSRIRLACTPLLIAGNGMVLLIEGGIGQVFKGNTKLEEIYAIERTDLLEEDLERTGYSPADITIVTCSHLHWDHSGTCCKFEDGRYVSRFPNAKYIFQKGEWETAMSVDPFTRASYIPESLEPIWRSGQLALIEGDYEINGEIRLIRSGGHTPHHQIFVLESDGEGLIFWGDIIPTSSHIHIPHIMAYDLNPAETYSFKERYLLSACGKNYISAFPHDTNLGFGKIRFDGKKYLLAGGA